MEEDFEDEQIIALEEEGDSANDNVGSLLSESGTSAFAARSSHDLVKGR